jgi:GNAT superfamily N-acetyltransferase
VTASWAPPPRAALALWRELTGDPVAFVPGSRAAVRGSRGICRPGWVGAVRLGDAFAVEIGAARDEPAAALLACQDPTDPDEVVVALQPTETLGPGVLAYLPEPSTEPDGAIAMPSDVTISLERVAVVRGWLDSLPPDDVQESGLAELDEVLVARSRGRPVAAAGHHVWPTGVAHLGVVADPVDRGRGFGVAVARAAVQRAQASGLTPQWRAAETNAASRAVARRLGFVEVGRQFSVRLP